LQVHESVDDWEHVPWLLQVLPRHGSAMQRLAVTFDGT